ncbi:MAG TPA: TolC family outer membrane protein [Solimonas sp.]|nr:TolC family outer membrane protein [Solimonas sp.]
MRPTTLLLLCATFALPTAASANELLKVYEQALQNDATWQAAQHARDAAVEAKPQARAALLPQLGANATQSIQESTIHTEGSPSREVPRDEPWSASLNLSQSVFDWASIQQLRQSDDQVALAETSLRAAAQNLRLRVAEAYFNVLAAADTLRSSQDENQAFKRQLELAQARFEVGLSAITEVQEAQARHDLTNASLIQAQQTLDTARSALAEITGAAYQPTARLQDELPLAAPQPADIEAWVKTAQDNNLDVLGARLAADFARKGIQVARAGHYPTLDLSASTSVSESSSSNFDPATGTLASTTDRRTDADRVALTLNLPLFSGLATQSRVRQAVSTREQRDAEYDGARRLVERQTRDAYLGVNSGAARVGALKQAVVSATTALEAAQSGLEVGTRTFIDVLNAQQLLSAAQRDYYRSRYDYLLARLRLRQAGGTLGDADIGMVDGLLVGP